VTVYRPGKDSYAVDTTQELTGDEVLPDFRCKVADFFFCFEDTPPPQPQS
jgi:hypothetical protein